MKKLLMRFQLKTELRLFALAIVGIIMFCAASQKTTIIYMIGDSTMANKKAERYPETGWGQVFGDYFQKEKVVIDNRAINGRSTKSFINENRWDPIRSNLKEGDYVFIEFGHNDQKIDDPKRGTTIKEFKENLAKYIRETKEKKAVPVLMTPVSRRSFPRGDFVDSHGEYGKAVREVAKEENVYFIDMQEKSEKLLKELGSEPSKKLFLWAEPGVLSNYPDGVKDNSHFSTEGAHKMAQFAVEGIRELKLPLEKLLAK